MEKDFINKFIGNRIKSCRIDSGLTLKELAHKVELSEGNVQRYEAGNIANVSVAVLIKFANALNVAPAHLLGWDSSTTISVSSEEQSMLNKYRKLSSAGQDYVNDQIDFRLNKERSRLKSEEETCI